MATATGATDPNGWLPRGSQPGSVMVKIQGTSRETMNGQLAVVLAYMEDSQRYLVHMTKSQQQASLKAENLLKASWMEQFQAQYELIQNHPEIKRKLIDFYQGVERQLPAGVKPEYVAVAGLLLLLVAMYVVGFTKTMMALSLVLLMVLVIAPDLGSPVAVIARNFPMRTRAIIRQQIPFVGNYIADNQYLSMAVVALILAFFGNALFVSPSKAAAAARASSSSSSSIWSRGPVMAPPKAVMDRVLQEEIYNKGYDDCKAGLERFASLPVPVAATEEEEGKHTMTDGEAATAAATPRRTATVEDEFDYDFVDRPPQPLPKASRGRGGLDWYSMLSLFFLGQRLFSMGRTAEGGWDYQLAMANLRTMDQMNMALFAFSIYRVASALYRQFA